MDRAYENLRGRYEATIGAWPEALDALVEHDPELAHHYVTLAATGHGDALSPKERAFVLIAANAACTYFDSEALAHYIRVALSEGATRLEIVEILELTSVLGIHSSISGFPILSEELAQTGIPLSAELTERQIKVKRAHMARRGGTWSPQLDPMLSLQPELLDAYSGYYVVPSNRGALDALTRELIYITIDAHTTHLYTLGLRLHIRDALALGVTAGAISQIFALLASIGISTMTRGLPILAQVCEEVAQSKVR